MKDNYPQPVTEFMVLDGEMIRLFIQDPQMKSSFYCFPKVLMVDATHMTNKVVALFLTKNKDESSLHQMLSIFKTRKLTQVNVNVPASKTWLREQCSSHSSHRFIAKHVCSMCCELSAEKQPLRK